jgi:DNA uptake protein ComE-like DNA-binding protein
MHIAIRRFTDPIKKEKDMLRSKCIAWPATIGVLIVLGLSNPLEGQVGQSGGLVNPDLASEKELLALPHMNATMVKGIMEQRPFSSISDLHALLSKYLNKEQVAEVYGKAFVQLNLNTAAESEILLIPGVGKRMLREFQEYRPYKSLAQFRKEIGKYVDQKEVARLEQYVFVPINLNTSVDEDILTIPGMGKRMLREFKEYRPYKNIEQFRKEIGKYVDKKEVARLERYVTLN